METQFYIYKKAAHPDGPVAIVSNDPAYPKAQKMAFYAHLGHQVFDVPTEAKMKYVVQCFISDKKGIVIRISDCTPEQLQAAYLTACAWYGDVLPCPDNGRYEDYVR